MKRGLAAHTGQFNKRAPGDDARAPKASRAMNHDARAATEAHANPTEQPTERDRIVGGIQITNGELGHVNAHFRGARHEPLDPKRLQLVRLQKADEMRHALGSQCTKIDRERAAPPRRGVHARASLARREGHPEAPARVQGKPVNANGVGR